MDEIVIRPAEISDMQSIYGFVCRLEEEDFDFDAFRECYETCLGANHHHYLVATVNGKAIGYLSCHGQILLHHLGLVYEIQEMYVDAEFRSRGVGKLLLERLEQVIGKEDYKLLEVSSNKRRTDAHRFYINNGFTQTTYKFKKL